MSKHKLNEIWDIALKLKDFMERKKYSGYDPFDALNSRIIEKLSFNQKYLKIFWTNFFRRFPVNLRPVFRVPEGHNPKGLGLTLWGYAKLARLNRSANYSRQIEHLMDLLERYQSRGYSGNCWGYNFPWQSRALFLPKFTPTIVNSAFIGHALLDTYFFTGNRRAQEMAIPIKDFILNDVNRTVSRDGFCFSYTPIDNRTVHNANLLGASLLIRLNAFLSDKSLEKAALDSIKYSISRQNKDGSWPYSERYRWVDSYHTGFNLQAIQYFIEAGYDQFIETYRRGIKFYASNFFLKDGTPKHFANRVYPLDIHSPAQAIVVFSRADESYETLLDTILSWMIENMYLDKKGYFCFRKTPLFKNRICYMRWSQAWVFHALTDYLVRNTPEGKKDGKI